MFEAKDFLQRWVPHRPPILRVHQLVANNGTTAIVLGREPTGPGSLPWELGAIEGLAQSSAALLAHGLPLTNATAAPRGMLVAVKRFLVHAEPATAAEITYHVRLVRRLGPTALVAGHAEADGQRLASGELTLWLAPA